MTTHLIIPDTQVKPGVPTEYLSWIGRYILDRKPDVVIHLGDHWDFPSLSQWDKGKIQMEGRRYHEDVQAGNTGLRLIDEPVKDANRKRRNPYSPRKVLLRGNHEHRLQRAVESAPHLEGFMSFSDLNTRDWEVYDFLVPVEIDGISYSHYWANPMTGKPYGGQALTLLKQLGHSYVQGHRQAYEYANRFVKGRKQLGITAGACLTPNHKVLTADLRYIPLGAVTVGDQLVSFDESHSDSQGRSRRYKTGTVLAVRTVPKPVVRVTLESGKQFTATQDHRWLCRVFGQAAAGNASTYKWRTTDSFRRGTVVPRVLPEWEPDLSHDAGYLQGMYDGEGCYYQRTSGQHVSGQLTVSQKPGPVLDKTEALLTRIVGQDCRKHLNSQGVADLRIGGGLPNIAKVLGSIRPVRLLSKFHPEHLGRMTEREADKVVRIEPAGVQPVVEVDIDAKTMIVEGYPHHNCYLHDEDYKGPQGNAHWRGLIMLHEVEDGAADVMEVSIDYLCRRYTGLPVGEFLRQNYPEQTGTGFLWRT